MALSYDVDNNSVYIVGGIEESMVISLLEFRDKMLNKVKDLNYKPEVTITVLSDGGCVYSMFAIIDIINSLKPKCKVTTTAHGKVMSAGVVIWLSGDVRTAGKHTFFMIHNVDTELGGDADKINCELKHTRDVSKRYFDIVSKETTLDMEQLEKDIHVFGKVYFTSRQMLSKLKDNEYA